MLSFLFAFVSSASDDAPQYTEIKYSDIPNCDSMVTVNSVKSGIIRRILQPNNSLCIKAEEGPAYKGYNLSFVFSKQTVNNNFTLFINKSGNWSFIQTTGTPGGASLAQYNGFLYIKAQERNEIHIGYTTFSGKCKNAYISGNPSGSLSMTAKLETLNCYFNGVPGKQKVTLYSNNSKCECVANYYPQFPELRSVTTKMVLYNDQTAVGFSMFQCFDYKTRSANYVSVEANVKIGSFVSSWIDSKYPKFYPLTKANQDYFGLIFGLAFGIPFGSVFVAFAVIILYFVLCDDDDDDDCCCCRCCCCPSIDCCCVCCCCFGDCYDCDVQECDCDCGCCCKFCDLANLSLFCQNRIYEKGDCMPSKLTTQTIEYSYSEEL